MNINNVNSGDYKYNQPTINIGMIGSVSNGKSSIILSLTGTKTQKHSHEQSRNITIKLGYANCKIYQCPMCPKPKCYQSTNNEKKIKCKHCDNNDMILRKHISLVDCPGHNLLMQTMLNGTCVMNSTILVASLSNNSIPAPQTIEHLIASNIVKLDNSIVCVNKIDLIKQKHVDNKINTLSNFLKNTIAQNSPIIPISANFDINIDVLCEYLCNIEEPKYDVITSIPEMIIIRSFNINRQQSSINNIMGGVVGGSIKQGKLTIGDSVAILPGYYIRNKNENINIKWIYKPLLCDIISLNSEKTSLKEAISGGLIGVKLNIDPALAVNDKLVGSILTLDKHQNNYKIYEKIYVILEKINRYDDKIINLKNGDNISINYNASNINSKIIKIRNNKMEIELLDKPICIKNDEYITISVIIPNDGKNYTLVGRAIVKDGIESQKL